MEKSDTKRRNQNIFIGIVASIYAIWLIYAGGVDYLLLTMLLYAPGIIIYAWVQKENKEKIFTKSEWIAAAVIVLLFILAVIQIANGSIDISNM